VIGTITFAPLFAGSVIVLGPYLLSGWKLDAPFFAWAPSRWIGGALAIFPIPPLLDFLVRFVSEGHGTPAPFAPPRRLVVSGPFRYVRNPAYLCAVSMITGQGLFLASTSVLAYAVVVALAFHLFVVLYEEPTLRETFGADSWPTAARCLGGSAPHSWGSGWRPLGLDLTAVVEIVVHHASTHSATTHTSRAPAAELGCDPKTLRSRLGRGEAVRIPDAPP